MRSKKNRIKKNNRARRNSEVSKASFSQPRNVEVRHLGVASDRSLPRVDEGKFDVAVESKSQLVTYDENLLERARTQWQFGDWKSLTRLDRETLQHHPDRATLALLSAAGHMQRGSLDQARQYVRLAQDWGCAKQLVSRVLIAGVHNSLGRAAGLVRQEDKAFRHFESAIQVGAPGSDSRLLTRARASEQLHQLGLELPHAQQIKIAQMLPQGPISALTPHSLSVDHSLNRQKDLNLASYLNRNGESLFKAGNYKLAMDYFKRAVDMAPDDAWYCQNLAEAAARLDFKKGDEWESEQLGKTMDETGKWDVVVRHYRHALKLDSAKVEVHCKAQTFEVEPVQEGQIDNPIFIVGCGHSGTSLMLAMVGNHPNIHPIPKESALFLRTDATIHKIMREWDAECVTQGKMRWAEKTPPHIFQIHRFLALRPQARFVLMLRDGRDVVCSLKSRIGYANIEDRLDRWVYDNMAGLRFWQHPQVKVVKYEDLIQSPEQTLQAICDFLREDYSSQMLDYHKTEHSWYSDKIIKPEEIKTHEDHMNNRNWQINQAIFDGRGRWLTEMTDVEKECFKQSLAQKYLEQFGYVFDCNW